MMKYFLSILLMSTIFFLSSLSFALSVEERLKRLEEKLTALEQTYLTNNQEVASTVAKAGELQREAITVQGKIDATTHLADQRYQELSKRLIDLDQRFTTLQERINLLLTQTQRALRKIDPQGATAADAYQKGLGAFEEGNSLEAIAKFQLFLQKYSKHEFAASAQLWIGESYFRMQDFKRAVKEYQIFIEKHPKHDRVPEALLKQGMAFTKLSLKEAAQPFFEKIIKEFSSSKEALLAQEELQKLSAQPASALPPTSTLPEVSSESKETSSYPSKTIQEERQPQTPGQP